MKDTVVIQGMSQDDKATFVASTCLQIKNSAREIFKEDLRALRKMKKRFCALKYDNHFYLLPRRPNAITSTVHLCTYCKKCYALPTIKGGCDKVYKRGDKCMENFPFVEIGLETTDTPKASSSYSTSFFVLKCQDFQEDKRKK